MPNGNVDISNGNFDISNGNFDISNRNFDISNRNFDIYRIDKIKLSDRFIELNVDIESIEKFALNLLVL